MTKKEFENLKVGDFVDDSYNGIFRVWNKEEHSFDADYVEFDTASREWIVAGLSFEVTEEDATTEDNGERWRVYCEEEIAEYEKYYLEET